MPNFNGIRTGSQETGLTPIGAHQAVVFFQLLTRTEIMHFSPPIRLSSAEPPQQEILLLAPMLQSISLTGVVHGELAEVCEHLMWERVAFLILEP